MQIDGDICNFLEANFYISIVLIGKGFFFVLNF